MCTYKCDIFHNWCCAWYLPAVYVASENCLVNCRITGMLMQDHVILIDVSIYLRRKTRRRREIHMVKSLVDCKRKPMNKTSKHKS
jgi:hypothetical protein